MNKFNRKIDRINDTAFDPSADAGPTKALLYCRVSTKRQREEGHGLDSQELRCRQYAAAKGYAVEAVFPDDVSGGGDFLKRPGMVALLAYMDACADERFVVIFDDLKRYARDTEFHLKLRREMAARGARRECLNFNFEDSPEGKFFETIAAAQGELEREQNGRQVRQKMRARIDHGYYCFAPVLGYRYGNAPDGGKILVPDEPNASIVKEALEGFASGRFQTASEVKRFLEGFPTIPKTRYGEVNLNGVFDMLKRPLYAGRITVAKWGIHLQPGKHEPLITYGVWKAVQDRLEGRANAPQRKDLHADFPLRGFVCCAACGTPMTAAWSKGRNAHYPYYVCFQKGCELKGKSVRKERVEAEFEALLKTLTPVPALLDVVKAMFADRWTTELRSAKDRSQAAKVEVAVIEQKIGRLVARIVDATNDQVIQAYESQIALLTDEKLKLEDIAARTAAPRAPFEAIFRTAWAFISNPWKLWTSEHLEQRRMVLRLAFPEPVTYCRNGGFRTAAIAEPFRVLGGFAGGKLEVVGPAGFEPATTPL